MTDSNAFLRESEIDRAVTLKSLDPNALVEPLDPNDIAHWDHAFSVIDAYAAAVEKLLDPARRTEAQGDLVGLGEAIGKTTQVDIPASLSSGFSTLGGLLLQMHAESEAMAAIKKADPGIQGVFVEMSTAIGDSPKSGIRETVFSSYDQILGAQQIAFLAATTPDTKRAVVRRYIDIMNQRDDHDRTLASVRQSIQSLAVAHAHLAAGRAAGAGATLALIQREYATYSAERDEIKKQHTSTGTE